MKIFDRICLFENTLSPSCINVHHNPYVDLQSKKASMSMNELPKPSYADAWVDIYSLTSGSSYQLLKRVSRFKFKNLIYLSDTLCSAIPFYNVSFSFEEFEYLNFEDVDRFSGAGL